MATEDKKTEYTLAEAAKLANRTPQRMRDFCNDDPPIDHKRFGRTYVITQEGLDQAIERIKNSRPGPKGPRNRAA